MKLSYSCQNTNIPHLCTAGNSKVAMYFYSTSQQTMISGNTMYQRALESIEQFHMCLRLLLLSAFYFQETNGELKCAMTLLIRNTLLNTSKPSQTTLLLHWSRTTYFILRSVLTFDIQRDTPQQLVSTPITFIHAKLWEQLGR